MCLKIRNNKCAKTRLLAYILFIWFVLFFYISFLKQRNEKSASANYEKYFFPYWSYTFDFILSTLWLTLIRLLLALFFSLPKCWPAMLGLNIPLLMVLLKLMEVRVSGKKEKGILGGLTWRTWLSQLSWFSVGHNCAHQPGPSWYLRGVSWTGMGLWRTDDSKSGYGAYTWCRWCIVWGSLHY